MAALLTVKTLNQRTVSVGALLMLFVTWQLSWHITDRVTHLQVKSAPKVDHQGPAVDPKSFYPVWVKQAVAMTPMADNTPLDSFFRRQELPVTPPTPSPAPPEPDYQAMFERQVRIDGISDNGVFINGIFFKAGTKLEAFSLLKPDGSLLAPTLEAVSANHVTFQIDGQTVRFHYRKPS